MARPRIVPFQDITLSPAAMVFHYGQEMFEGMKAYKGADREELPLPPGHERQADQQHQRPPVHPPVPEEDYVQAVKAIVSVDQD